jgi:hypothetical protein
MIGLLRKEGYDCWITKKEHPDISRSIGTVVTKTDTSTRGSGRIVNLLRLGG